eukprot:3469653-Pleurochrysis_carterae.AAC.7
MHRPPRGLAERIPIDRVGVVEVGRAAREQRARHALAKRQFRQREARAALAREIEGVGGDKVHLRCARERKFRQYAKDLRRSAATRLLDARQMSSQAGCVRARNYASEPSKFRSAHFHISTPPPLMFSPWPQYMSSTAASPIAGQPNSSLRGKEIENADSMMNLVTRIPESIIATLFPFTHASYSHSACICAYAEWWQANAQA